MKKTLTIALTTSALFSLPASAVTLFAGWDAFTAAQEQTSAPTILDSDTSATMSGTDGSTTSGNSWSDWNNGGQGASDDGTFGNLSSTVAMASTAVGSGSSGGNAVNLSLSRQHKAGSLIFTLTNNSGADRLLDGFYFDGAAHNTQAARRWTLSVSGAISGTPAANTGLFQIGDMDTVANDWGVDLNTLGDNVWEAGTDAVFTLDFTGGDSPNGTGGGHETLIDNIGITGTTIAVIPEPSAVLLSALGLTSMLLRRKR
ncbi:MAG: PEP-CTERM sorting domain-containing protein [Akkermansiaceae bacterium]